MRKVLRGYIRHFVYILSSKVSSLGIEALKKWEERKGEETVGHALVLSLWILHLPVPLKSWPECYTTTQRTVIYIQRCVGWNQCPGGVLPVTCESKKHAQNSWPLQFPQHNVNVFIKRKAQVTIRLTSRDWSFRERERELMCQLMGCTMTHSEMAKKKKSCYGNHLWLGHLLNILNTVFIMCMSACV